MNKTQKSKTEKILAALGLDWNPKPVIAPHKINALAFLVFLTGLVILVQQALLWPGIILVIGATLVFRKTLFRRNYAALISALVFGGLYYMLWADTNWSALLVVLFTTAALTLLFREVTHIRRPLPEERFEQMNLELKDEYWE